MCISWNIRNWPYDQSDWKNSHLVNVCVRSERLWHSGNLTRLGSPAQCPSRHQDQAPRCPSTKQTTLNNTSRFFKKSLLHSHMVFAHVSFRTLSLRSSAGGSHACSLTFHSLICWSHERRLYFLNLLGVFGWTPGRRMCLKTEDQEQKNWCLISLLKGPVNMQMFIMLIDVCMKRTLEPPGCNGHRPVCSFHSWFVSVAVAAQPHQSPCSRLLWSHSCSRHTELYVFNNTGQPWTDTLGYMLSGLSITELKWNGWLDKPVEGDGTNLPEEPEDVFLSLWVTSAPNIRLL